MLPDLLSKHKEFWTKENTLRFIKMLGLFLLSLVVLHFANQYVANLISVPVGDIILSHIPTFDIDFLVVQGVLIFSLFMVVLLIIKPRYILFTIAAYSIFIILRSFFISLTHLGIDPHEIILDTHSIGYGIYNLIFNSKSDFFFSGHTGTPFLMGLIFMRNKWLSRFLFFVSFLFGLGVLMGHIHYSIDVFAAPFMTYTIFVISKKLFPKEYALINPES